ncbi:MAG: XdhC family protein [Pseudomonadota bacterium]
MPSELLPPDTATLVANLREEGAPFAFATIVRTAGATAAKPGARAVIGADGEILSGWLGGGCTKGAVRRAAVQAMANGTPQLVSVAPEDHLADQGVAPGDVLDGKLFARNGCPSRGVIEIFIEPCVPSPELVVIGTSPVAQALAELGARFHWEVSAQPAEGVVAEAVPGRLRAIVVATQGQGDLTALTAALNASARHVAFVGSRKKYASLAAKLAAAGLPQASIDTVSAPAGLDIGAVTPEEIALSILAELTQLRRTSEKKETDHGTE